MKHTLQVIISLGTIVPAMWFTAYRLAPQYVERDSSGQFVLGFHTQSGMDAPVITVRGDKAQLGLERVVKANAR